MKKNILLLLALSPMSLFAQASAASEEGGFISFLFALLICILTFISLRQLFCWYWKINKIISNQEEIIRILKKISNENNTH